MKSIRIELPDKLAAELNVMVKAGWFSDDAEVVRLALLEFVRRHRVDLGKIGARLSILDNV